MIPISLESSEPGSDGTSPSLGTRWYWREKNRKSEHRAEKSEWMDFTMNNFRKYYMKLYSLCTFALLLLLLS